ncbi:MAG: hypothetical protein P0Y62_05940 [Candidatus Chryseobacterium colombiense]|nr:hypothetical protein [Chryseobacterium sp.]WEK71095.1 MAG: hypothetical protein P0Y62_05940 [Chryseobacterium sp.]
MELDNFKELWNKDGHDLPEISLEKQNEIYSPLEMIKINMKTEFWLMVITLPMVFIGFPFTTNNFNVRIISIFVTFLTIGLVVYFYSRFLRIYKRLIKTSTNTNYDLFNIKTQLLVCREIYISYYISYLPLAFVSSLQQINFQFDEDYHIAIFAISFLIIILLLCITLKYWVYYMYGKYIEDIVRLVDELNGIGLPPLKVRNKSWFERSQRYFINKLGVKGNILNTILWFVSVYLLLIVVLIVILSIIIIVGAKLDLINLNTLLKALNQGN